MALAERAGTEMHRAAQAAWMRRLDRDLDHLFVAVRAAHARGTQSARCGLAGALWWYLWVRGHLREGLQWVEPAIGQGPGGKVLVGGFSAKNG